MVAALVNVLLDPPKVDAPVVVLNAPELPLRSIAVEPLDVAPLIAGFVIVTVPPSV